MKIDYDELRRIHRLEKNSSKLVEVEEDFVDVVRVFVEDEKKKYLDSLKNFSSSDVRQFSNIKRVVDEIFLMRKKKLLNKALISSYTKDPTADKLAYQEKAFFKKMFLLLEDYDVDMNISGEQNEKKDSQIVDVKMLSDVTAFLGSDMKEYGPFSSGDKIQLPSKVAKLLFSRKLAEEV
jgi:DNA replication initiation complex subunit (GINS family)